MTCHDQVVKLQPDIATLPHGCSLHMFDFDFLNINYLDLSRNIMEHSEPISRLLEQEKTLAAFCENILDRLKDPALAGLTDSINLSRCLEGLIPLMESGRELINELRQSKEDWLERLRVDEMLINTTKRSLADSMEQLACEQANFKAERETWESSANRIVGVRSLDFLCSFISLPLMKQC
jgi:hypothetical protein